MNDLLNYAMINGNLTQDAINEAIMEGKKLILSTLGSDERKMLPEIYLESGEIYIGEWKNGMKDGLGKNRWKDVIYQGEWKENKKSGWGKLSYNEGGFYEGEWENDEAHGKGTSVHQNGTKYIGDWVHNESHGKGIEIWADGSTYTGDYFQGKKQGSCEMLFPNGTSYIGEFSSHNFHGFGTIFWVDQRVYRGEWKQGLQHGKGVYTWPDGKKYEGVRNYNRQGKGIHVEPDEVKYIGGWNEGKKYHIGCLISKSEKPKLGYWKDGKVKKWNSNLDGNDINLQEKIMKILQFWQNAITKNESKHLNDQKGQFPTNFIQDSNQTIILPSLQLKSGAIYQGEWKNSMKDGKGIIKFPGGLTYEGEWQNNLKSGWGKLCSVKGEIYNGQWLDDLPVRDIEWKVECQKFRE